MNISTLYVLVQQWPYMGISLLGEDVYPDKATAEEAKVENLKSEVIQKSPPILVMTLEDYISDFGSGRYSEGYNDSSSDEGNYNS